LQIVSKGGLMIEKFQVRDVATGEVRLAQKFQTERESRLLDGTIRRMPQLPCYQLDDGRHLNTNDHEIFVSTDGFQTFKRIVLTQ
jgi:hypothetical protein